MKLYEVMIITDPKKEDAENYLKQIFAQNKAIVDNYQNLGNKKLAYTIDNKDRGVYHLFVIQMDWNTENDLKRDLSIQEYIMRVFITHYDPNKTKVSFLEDRKIESPRDNDGFSRNQGKWVDKTEEAEVDSEDQPQEEVAEEMPTEESEK